MNGVGKTKYTRVEAKTRPLSITLYKSYSKWSKGLNVYCSPSIGNLL
jgi:hypothetical protein